MKQNLILSMLLACATFSGVVMAHPGHAETSGLAVGLMHPLIGTDHVFAMLAVGLWIEMHAGRQVWLPVVCFLVLVAVGAVTGVLALPGIETGIAASILVMGLILVSLVRLPVIGAALAGIFALHHGAAHAAEIPSFVAPLTFGLGFLLVTAALQLSGVYLARVVRRVVGAWSLRGVGALIAGSCTWLLLGAYLGR